MSSPILLCFRGTRFLLCALCFGRFFLIGQKRIRAGATVWQGQCVTVTTCPQVLHVEFLAFWVSSSAQPHLPPLFAQER